MSNYYEDIQRSTGVKLVINYECLFCEKVMTSETVEIQSDDMGVVRKIESLKCKKCRHTCNVSSLKKVSIN